MGQLTSTRVIFDETKSYITRTQASLVDIQRQISSGKQHDSFDDLVGNVTRLKALEDASGRLDSYLNSINRVKPRLQAADKTLEQLIDLGTELRNSITLRKTPAGDTLDLADIAGNILEQVEQLLNTSVDGQYIFAGGKSNAAPIKTTLDTVANYTSSATPFTTNTNYYLGDETDLSLRVSDGKEVTYNIKASNAAFQQIISAAHLSIEVNASEDNTVFTLAFDQVEAAINSLISLRSQNANNLSSLNNAADLHEKAKSSLAEQIGDLTDTDIVQASIDVAFNETILTATFQTFARINNLKLLDFLT